jgi:hypothetical protein
VTFVIWQLAHRTARTVAFNAGAQPVHIYVDSGGKGVSREEDQTLGLLLVLAYSFARPANANPDTRRHVNGDP